MPLRRSIAAIALLAACKDDVTATRRPDTTAPNPQGVSVLTQHNDNARTGWNDSEALLTTSNVNVQEFGKLFSLPVDDQVYAQPLVVGKLAISGGVHNVVYVATVANTLYAFDGDDGTLYWKANFTASGMRPPRNTDMTGACGGAYSDFSGNIGVVGTPVIDPATKTIYFVARSTNGARFVQRLHAVDIVSGKDVAGSPVEIGATYAGTGAGSVNGTITFDSRRQNQRQALSLVNGVVYVSFASHCDWGPFHGWILGYDAATLQRTVVYNDTPDGSDGGLWQSGTGMAADADGNLYAVAGNGTVGDGADPTSPTNRAESALKLVPSDTTLRVASYFTPGNYELANERDLDLGGMGSLLIPGTRWFLTGAKDGNLFLLDRDDMGGYDASADRVRQAVSLSTSAQLHTQAAYYGGSSGEFVYVWSENDPLRAIPFDRASGLLQPGAQVVNSGGGVPGGGSGAVLTVSSNGTAPGSAILWAAYASSGDAGHQVSPGILRAYDATDVSRELWNNHQNLTRDRAGNYAKFATPTVANGHVYLPTFSSQVVVYGLLR